MDGRLLRSVTRSLLPASTQYVDMCPRPPRPARGDHWGPVSLGTSPFWSFFVSHEYHLRSSILPNDPKLFVATDEYAVSVVCSDYICFKTEFQNHTFFWLKKKDYVSDVTQRNERLFYRYCVSYAEGGAGMTTGICNAFDRRGDRWLTNYIVLQISRHGLTKIYMRLLQKWTS